VRKTVSRVAQEFRARPAIDPTWSIEPLDAAFTPFELPVSSTPKVSVIIPTYGELPYTLACLRSIARHGAKTSFEIVVVDDASPEDNSETLRQIDGIRTLRNSQNLGFIGSCNAGAKLARGEYLCFLNNDTQVTAGWLDHLLACFVDDPLCGIAGSRLAYPDGRLQEAGAIVYSNGESWNYGRFEDRNDPRFLYRREADYVSGASLMVDASLFHHVGGFDNRFAPAYCEDMDLAFSVRAAGRRVIYQPASLVVHCEGVSSGVDPFSGVKRYQLANREKFVAKWASVLSGYPKPGVPVEQAVNHGRIQHILIVDALAPDPTRDSGSLRMINIMRIIRELGWRVSFAPDNRRASKEEIARLGSLGIRTLCKPWAPSLEKWLKREGHGLDAVMLCRHYVAEPYITLVRRLVPNARIIFDTVDLHFLREQRAAEHAKNPSLARQAEASRQKEFALIQASDVTFVVSPVEQNLLARELPAARIELLSNIHEVPGAQRGFQDRRNLVFVGGFGHPPNEDAVNWLVTAIFPRVRQMHADMTLHLIGDMTDEARNRYSVDRVFCHGRQPDILPWMDGCRIALAPLRFGAGVKGKVNMAMSHGLPVVATTIAAEGMNLADGRDVLIADDAEAFATAILRLYSDEALWQELSLHGLENVRRYFSFDAARSTLERILR
jgi:O-antigen biosynthesis protein